MGAALPTRQPPSNNHRYHYIAGMAYFTARDGARLHYHDIGRGDPIMLLHGFAMPAFLWLPLVLPLAHRARFILPDLRGFGGSHHAGLSQPRLLNQHADDVADLLRALDLRDVRLGGLSMGACTGLQYHRRYGFERVRSYLHMDQAPCTLNGADWQMGLLGAQQAQKLSQWKTLLRALEPYRGQPFDRVPKVARQKMWATLNDFLHFAFHNKGWRAVSYLARFERMIRLAAPVSNWTIYLDVMRSYFEDDYDWRPTLPHIDIPVTVMIGNDSAMYPAEGQRMIGALVPHARVVNVANCGHVIPFEAPRVFERELRRFIET